MINGKLSSLRWYSLKVAAKPSRFGRVAPQHQHLPEKAPFDEILALLVVLDNFYVRRQFCLLRFRHWWRIFHAGEIASGDATVSSTTLPPGQTR